MTSFIREKLCESNQSFTFETVMSHPSKLDEIKNAKKLGYRIYLYFVCLDDAEHNKLRVRDRVEKGGHSVDEKKIVSRYYHTLDNLFDAIKLSNRAYMIDNSKNNNGLQKIAEYNEGKMTILCDENLLPKWFLDYVIKKM
jgi:predicted ABC-type ATPase